MSDQCSHEDLRDEIRELKEIIKPMVETYAAMSKLGSWAKGLLVIISIIVGLVLSLRALFGK